MLKNRLPMVLVLTVLVMTACGQGPKPSASEANTVKAATKPNAGPPPTVSGQTAFWEMYKSAFAWSRDVQPLILTSKELAGFKNESGRAALWSATFASPSKAEARTFTYSIAETSEFAKGVNVGGPIRWGGPTREVMPFETYAFNNDSTAAFEAASAEAKEWLAKHPGTPVSFTLGCNFRFSSPVWYVMWGNKKSGYAAFVNATNGQVMHPR